MFNFCKILLTSSFFFLCLCNLSAEPFKPYLKLDSFLYSETVSISDAISGQQSTYERGGERQLGSVWLESGFKNNRISFSTIYREEHRYKFSPDTADIYNSISSSHEVDDGRMYKLDLTADRFRAKGVRLGYGYDNGGSLAFEVGGSYFEASKLLNGKLVGEANSSSTNDYDYDIDVDYSYDEEVLFGRTGFNAPSGKGLSFDVNAKWRINKQVSLSLDIKDLFGKIRWDNAPRTVATATSDIKNIGDDGFVVIDPNIQGRHFTQEKFIQTIKPSGSLDLKYNLKKRDKTLLLKTRLIENKMFSGVGGEYSYNQGVVSGVIWPRIGVVEIGYRNKKMGVNVGVDNINLSKAKTLWLSLEYNN